MIRAVGKRSSHQAHTPEITGSNPVGATNPLLMKYFKVLNINRQGAGPIVVTEKGYNEMMNSMALAPSIQLIGECDASGNLITEIAENNFISAPKKKVIFTEPSKKSSGRRVADIDSDDDSEPDPLFSKTKAEPELVDFENLIPQENNGNIEGPKPGIPKPGAGSGNKTDKKVKGDKRGTATGSSANN